MEQNLFHAWAAGIVDGEGCIAIKRNHQDGNIYYCLWVTVGQSGRSCPAILTALQKVYGGNLRRMKPDGRIRRLPRWMWTVAAREAEKMLTFITPFLIGKREQALVALDYRKQGMGRGKVRIGEAFYWKLRGFKNYKHRGTQQHEELV